MTPENIMTDVVVQVPTWVNWIAEDRDGVMCGYEQAPRVSVTGECWDSDGKVVQLYLGKPTKRWADSLVKWK